MDKDVLAFHLNKYYTEEELLGEVRKNKKLIEIFNLKCVNINTKYVNTREKMNRKMISIQYEVLDLYLKKLIKKMSITKKIINSLVIAHCCYRSSLSACIPKPSLPYLNQLLKYFEIRHHFINNEKFKSNTAKIKFYYTFYENAYRFTRGKARNYYKRTRQSPYTFFEIKIQ
jgi:hypothetical protein